MMKIHIWKTTCLAAAIVAMLLPAVAQSSSTAPTAPNPATTSAAQPPQTVHERKLNQQNRIGKGVENGGLTANEAGNWKTRKRT